MADLFVEPTRFDVDPDPTDATPTPTINISAPTRRKAGRPKTSAPKTATRQTSKTRIKKAAGSIKDIGVFAASTLAHFAQTARPPLSVKLQTDAEILKAASESPLPQRLAEALDTSERWHALLDRSETATPWLSVTVVAAPFIAAIVMNHLPDSWKPTIHQPPTDDE